ncbi:Protein asteroid 1 [Mactra antiquata]
MGVRGLSTFIDENKKIFLSDHKLHDTRVIIDGSNLYHFVYHHYNISHQFGGDYDHYARKCKRFFNLLKECNIQPYVVLDGGYDPDDSKLSTVLDRMNDRRKKVSLICWKRKGTVLPVLSYETFRQVLEELNIPHVACVYEADREIAVLAKRWNCPVMSNDSDFFLFDLSGGFIPLDYINMTLCVCNTESGKEYVLGKNDSTSKHEYIYLPVRYYNSRRFIELFKENCREFALPLFGTVMGNDFVELSELFSFHSQLRVPKNPDKRCFRVKAEGRIPGMLYWVDSVKSEESAIQQVLATITEEKQDSLKELLLNCVSMYKDIDKFEFFDVEKLICYNSLTNDDDDDDDDDNKAHVPVLKNFYGQRLPDWFVMKLQSCCINGSVIQNACVLHRVILNCQIEILKETSTYACSRHIRACIYGILFGSDDVRDGANRQNCVAEYDREGINTKKFYVKPIRNIDNLPAIANIDVIPSMATDDRKKYLLGCLGMNLSLNVDMDSMHESSIVLALTLGVWVKHAQPKVTENHLKSLLICIIVLHIKALDWVKMKQSQGVSPYIPIMYQDIFTAYKSTEESQLSSVMKRLEKHFARPEHTPRNPRDNRIIHGFSQYQSCYLDTLYLNQVLLLPVSIPSPSLILNSTFAYNLCHDLDLRPKPDQYLVELLSKDSPLLKVFTILKDTVIGLCKNDNFELGQRSHNDGQRSSSRSKGKSKKKKSRSKKVENNEYDVGTNNSDNSNEDYSHVVLANCDISNKFALLDMSE